MLWLFKVWIRLGDSRNTSIACAVGDVWFARYLTEFLLWSSKSGNPRIVFKTVRARSIVRRKNQLKAGS